MLDWTTAEIDRKYRALNKSNDPSEIRVVWLGNHTLEPVVRTAAVFAYHWGVKSDNFVAPFDRYFQEILDPQSETWSFKPDIIINWLSLRGMAEPLAEGSASWSGQMVARQVARVQEHIDDWVDAVKKRSNCHIYIANFPRAPMSRFGISDLTSASGEYRIHSGLNDWLADRFVDDPSVSIVDISHAVSRAGSDKSWNPRMYRLAKIEWNGPAVRYIGELFARHLRSQVRTSRKCIVVDLDNTLWGGVLGEDGVHGITIGAGNPHGESFAAFQSALLDMKARGVLLAACSKNNSADVDEAFRVRTMPVSLDDFTAKQVNWQPKHESIRLIAKQLNIGLDSLVFFDDNPAECELVRQMLPEVKVVHLPPDPSGYADLLYSMPDFDKVRLTDEDRRKTEQYRENDARETARSISNDLDSYLRSLETEVSIQRASEDTLARVHQLFAKTNQFNVTTIRYSLSEIKALLEDESCELQIVSANDRFGDLGIVGVYVLRYRADEAEIDSFAMSCRALGRGIESAVCNHIKRTVRHCDGMSGIRAKFVPTAKNPPASRFFEEQGFSLIKSLSDGTRTYQLNLELAKEVPCPGVSVKFSPLETTQ